MATGYWLRAQVGYDTEVAEEELAEEELADKLENIKPWKQVAGLRLL